MDKIQVDFPAFLRDLPPLADDDWEPFFAEQMMQEMDEESARWLRRNLPTLLRLVAAVRELWKQQRSMNHGRHPEREELAWEAIEELIDFSDLSEPRHG